MVQLRYLAQCSAVDVSQGVRRGLCTLLHVIDLHVYSILIKLLYRTFSTLHLRAFYSLPSRSV